MINQLILQNSEDFENYYANTRKTIVNLARGSKYNNVLEIGCGAGENLQYLKEICNVHYTCGIDIREEAIQLGKKKNNASELFCYDILSEKTSPLSEKKYDLIILSHVLEHFTNPELVLNKAVNLLAPNGEILVALPNIRHVSVVIPLLFIGDFKYKSAGQLDNTHYKFFTAKSAIEFFNKHGLIVTKFKIDISPKLKLLDSVTMGIFKGLLGWSLNFIIKKNNAR